MKIHLILHLLCKQNTSCLFYIASKFAVNPLTIIISTCPHTNFPQILTCNGSLPRRPYLYLEINDYSVTSSLKYNIACSWNNIQHRYSCKVQTHSLSILVTMGYRTAARIAPISGSVHLAILHLTKFQLKFQSERFFFFTKERQT